MAAGMRSALTDEFWRGYRKAAGLHHDDYDVVAFGDRPEMATELAELTVAGIKRATAGLVRQFGPDGEAPAVLEGHVVLLDGDDIIIAGDNAYFLPSFARLGLVPDAGITFHLARRIGAGRSLSSLMLAERIDAKTALDWGLAYAVVPAAEVVTRAQTVAHRLASGPCAVLGQIRALHTSTFDNSLQEQLRAERSAQEMTLETHDALGIGKRQRA